MKTLNIFKQHTKIMKPLKLLSLFLLFATVLFSCNTNPGNPEAAVYVFSRRIGGGDEKLVKTCIFNVAGGASQNYIYIAPSGREMARVELVANNKLKEEFVIIVQHGTSSGTLLGSVELSSQSDWNLPSFTFEPGVTRVHLIKSPYFWPDK